MRSKNDVEIRAHTTKLWTKVFKWSCLLIGAFNETMYWFFFEEENDNIQKVFTISTER